MDRLTTWQLSELTDKWRDKTTGSTDGFDRQVNTWQRHTNGWTNRSTIDRLTTVDVNMLFSFKVKM
jgi:hypothetical protein